jgi:hypothetical protein
MTTKINTEDGTVEVPTATEFIPQSEAPDGHEDAYPMVRYLQRVVDGKGIEVAAHEPAQSTVENHVFVCDECGQSESLASDMEFHLRTQHE